MALKRQQQQKKTETEEYLDFVDTPRSSTIFTNLLFLRMEMCLWRLSFLGAGGGGAVQGGWTGVYGAALAKDIKFRILPLSQNEVVRHHQGDVG